MKTAFPLKSLNALERLDLTPEQIIACACLGMAQLGFIAVLFNIYCGIAG